MTRSRFKTRPKRKLAFKNRHRILEEFDELMAASEKNQNCFRVISLVGVGGSGKTRLVDRLSSNAKKRGFRSIRVSLESEASGMEAAPLKAIRDQLSFECMLFDVALARYFSASGQIYAVASNASLSSNIAVKGAEAGAGVVGMFALPLTFAVEAFDRIKKQTVKTMKYQRDEFEDIDRIKDESREILERLPYYLGSDLERRLSNSSEKYVFFYDSYEKQRASTLAKQSPWLREFVGALDRGVHVIATRETFDWPEKDWQKVCAPAYIIGQLPEADVKELFVEECSPSKNLLPILVEISQCIPFYVEILITEFHSLKAEKEHINPNDLPSSSTQLVARFIDHLEEPIQKLVLALASVQFFDRPLLHGLIRGLNLSIDLIDADEIVSAFFVEPVNEKTGIFKIHDLLTGFVRNNQSFDPVRIQALRACANIVSVAAQGNRIGDDLLLVFSGLCAGSGFNSDHDSEFVEHLVEVGYRLYDAGYWRELAKIGETKSGQSVDSDADVVGAFFAAISKRRTESVDDGLSSIRKLSDIRSRLGAHALSLDIETAYLVELSGDYGLARNEFERIFNSCTPFDPNRRPHYRGLLHHADLLIMDGQFESGADALLDAYEKIDPSQRFNWAELVRHRGHAFRFSGLLEEAEALYLSAMEAAKDSIAMFAKIQTNLAECRAWLAPEIAVNDAVAAIEQNTMIGNKIEVSKAHSANAIALTQLGETKAAAGQVSLAETVTRNARYPAGLLFAKQASCLLHVANGHITLANAQHLELRKLIRQIGTYGHIACLTARVVDKDFHSDGYASFNWIAPSEIAERQQTMLKGFPSADLHSGI